MYRMFLLHVVALLSVSGVIAQGETKAEKKDRKDREKIERREAEVERRRITVDFNQVTKFPADYLGRSSRLYRIGLGEIRPYSEEGNTYYLLSVIGSESTATIPLADSVTFAMPAELARPLVVEIDRIRYRTAWGTARPVIGDVYFEVSEKELGGRKYYLAAVSCVAVIDFYNEQKRKGLGNCPLVK